MHHFLDNLLSNAIKFSPPSSKITLKIDYPSKLIIDAPKVATALLSKSGQKRATIKITDEGLGISEQLQQRIFDKYEVGNAMSGVPQLGLGLAFCKMVVEAHQGQIFVEDNQPHGSIFTVVI